MKYELIDGEVQVRQANGTIGWRGKPDGYPAKAIVPLPQSDDAVVLLDYMAGPKNFSNLLRISADGRVLWRAAPPEASTSDAYVEVRWSGDKFIANSWSGYLVSIDLVSGKPSSSEFVK